MFEISVEHHFDAAHYLRDYGGKCERVHGHRFRVVVALQGEKLNDIGIVYDFVELRRHLREVVERFDHVCLNDITPFDKVNPSSENIAMAIFQEMKVRLKGWPLAYVEVWESPESRVRYTPHTAARRKA